MSFQDITVRQIMLTDPIRVVASTPVKNVLEMMNRFRIGAVLITDSEEHLVGIFTERDFLHQAVEYQADWCKIPVSDWMSPHPYTIEPDQIWEEAAISMDRLRVRHLPVVENGKILGIISSRRLIHHRSEHLNLVIQERTSALEKLNEQILARDKELMYYIKVAARIQRQLVLPKAPPSWPEISWGMIFSPLDPLGGDFYDFVPIDDQHLGILIADVSGHGIPAAMIAILARTTFREIAPRTIHPGEVLDVLNKKICELAEEKFITACYAVIHRESMALTYANAGHPYPLHFSKQSAQIQTFSSRGYPLGISPEEVYSEEKVFLKTGDRLCFYTDGVLDTANEMGESFGDERFTRLFREFSYQSAIQMTKRVTREISRFQGARAAVDDCTMLIGEIGMDPLLQNEDTED